MVLAGTAAGCFLETSWKDHCGAVAGASSFVPSRALCDDSMTWCWLAPADCCGFFFMLLACCTTNALACALKSGPGVPVLCGRQKLNHDDTSRS